MSGNAIFVPFFGLMLLTMVVWVFMYIRRLAWITANNPDPQSISTPEKLNQILPEAVNYPSNNLKNLFELPVLFYALCLYLAWSDQVDQLYVYGAHAYLALRIAHSTVHCTVNLVLLRFGLYVASSLILWLMIARAAFVALTGAA